MTPDDSKAKAKRNRDNWKRRALAAEKLLTDHDKAMREGSQDGIVHWMVRVDEHLYAINKEDAR